MISLKRTYLQSKHKLTTSFRILNILSPPQHQLRITTLVDSYCACVQLVASCACLSRIAPGFRFLSCAF
uniref:Ovule protein n=1 Tax=Parascaris equorum TaxID=6256 RepID=A0A914RRT9_PAREQ